LFYFFRATTVKGALIMSTPLKHSKDLQGTSRRKRGGQPGNSNALKHGFYTMNFSPAERKGLAAVKGVVLEEEIALLRVLIKRFAEKLLASEDVSLKESSQHLAVVSEAMLRLAGLLRTHHMLGGSDTDTLAEALSQALEQVTAEMALAGREGSAEY
jgi:hypothetical protein